MAVARDGILWPVRFAATSYVLRVTLNAVTEDLTFPASGSLTTTRNYWLAGDDQADAAGAGDINGTGDLLKLLEDCLAAHTQGGTWTITGGGTTEVKISHSAADFTLLWTHANTTLDNVGAYWGYDVTSDDTSSLSIFTAPNMPQGTWYPNVPRAVDGRNQPTLITTLARSVSGRTFASNLASGPDERTLRWELLTAAKTLAEYAAATETTGALESAWTSAIGIGYPFRLYEDLTSRTSSSYTLLAATSLARPWQRNGQYRIRWDAELPCVEVS